jgi:itaconate CoA-transferase
MLEAMAEWMTYPLYYAFEGAPPPQRVGASHATIFPYGPFPTRDGDVMLGVQNEREWQAFCELVLERPEVAADPRFASNTLRSANRADLAALIAESTAHLSRAEMLDRLERAQIANASLNDMAGLWAHPQLRARDRWREVGTPVGPVPALLPPGQRDARMDPVPAVGEHTAAILAELGMGEMSDVA